VRHRLVADPGRDDGGRAGRGCLHREAARGLAAEPRQPAGQRQPGEDARGAALGAQAPARPHDQRLDGADRDAERLGDLGVRAPLELVQDERRALVVGQPVERAPDLLRTGAVVVRGGRREPVVERDLGGTPRLLAEALPAGVARDRQQPAERPLGARAARERAVGVEERGLGDVLGVGGVREPAERVAVDVEPVAAVQPLERRALFRHSADLPCSRPSRHARRTISRCFYIAGRRLAPAPASPS
jgi:hypothetical protein